MAEPSKPDDGYNDPIAFLAELKATCPEIVSVLTLKQAKLLSKTPNDPYDPTDVNEEYLTDAASFYGLKQKMEDANQALRTALLQPNKMDRDLDVEGFKARITALEKVKPVPITGNISQTRAGRALPLLEQRVKKVALPLIQVCCELTRLNRYLIRTLQT